MSPFDSVSEKVWCEDGTLSVLLAFAFILLVILFYVCIHVQYGRDEQQNEQLGLEFKGAIMEKIDEWLIKPFVPSSTKTFVAIIYFFWFITTITMGIHRYYHKAWGFEVLAQQSVPNFITYLFGCKGRDLFALLYTEKIPENAIHIPNPERDSPAELDAYFMFHLFAGVAWLTFGFIQIYTARKGWSSNPETQRKVHMFFGKFVALPALLAHLFFAGRMVLRNPVHQVFVVEVLYRLLILNIVILGVYGVMYAYKLQHLTDEDQIDRFKKMHKFRMISCWLQSIFGSGAIRVSMWFLWLVGHFFSPAIQARIDRTVCQSAAEDRGEQLGSAEQCVIPVLLNLTLTILINQWLLAILAHLQPMDNGDKSASLKHLKNSFYAVVACSVAVFLGHYWPMVDFYLQYILMVVSIIAIMTSVQDIIHAFEIDTAAKTVYGYKHIHGAVFGYHRNGDGVREHAD